MYFTETANQRTNELRSTYSYCIRLLWIEVSGSFNKPTTQAWPGHYKLNIHHSRLKQGYCQKSLNFLGEGKEILKLINCQAQVQVPGQVRSRRSKVQRPGPRLYIKFGLPLTTHHWTFLGLQMLETSTVWLLTMSHWSHHSRWHSGWHSG